ncbi:group II truncated hemoglobin [Neptuniibacter halophilus]|uniref:group II truncated hemoglobin n=1 Tax=Neptuniibacter halophilus TaxID=651666 RepID=UPI002573E7A5|nr:group II truncated hemoglobin [Neptuniibacter halophilus]
MQTPYELIGGAAGVKALAEEFYRVMDSQHAARGIRAMHGKDLSAVSDKLYQFLSGWFGGPQLYLKQHGTICLSSPHAKYAIGSAERDAWLQCMDLALDNLNSSPELKSMLKDPLFDLADMMTNRD